MPLKFNLGKTYSFLAINILTITLLFIVLNAGMFFVIKLLIHYYPSRSLASFDALKQVYPGMSPDDISMLLDETWDRPYQYEPWLGFKERPRSGKYVNISDGGFRLSSLKEKEFDPSDINIFVLGGSTTFGYGLDDGSTIPSHLQKQLTKIYPDKKIHVFNFGRAYYYLEQEHMLLLQLIKENKTPTIAIFIDGLNEGYREPFYSDEMASLFDAFNYNPSNLLAISFTRSSLMSVTNKIIEYLQVSVVMEKRNKSIDMTDTLERYKITRKMINLLAEDLKFKAYFFVQPVPGYLNNFRNHVFMKKEIPDEVFNKKIKFMEVLDKTVDNKNSFSLTNLLSDYKKQPFVDNVHYTSEVCSLIATAIAGKVQMPANN